MPPRKQAKSKPSLATSRKKKSVVEQYNNKQQKPNVSVQRYRKPNLHSNPWNYVTHSGYSPYRENDKEKECDEGTFGLSPAYLCECTLQTQDTTIAPNKPSKVYSLNSERIKIKPVKKKELPINNRISKNPKSSSFNHEFSPAFLCESILQAENTSLKFEPDSFRGVCSNSLLGSNLLQKKKQISNKRNSNHHKLNNQGQEHSSEFKYKRKSQEISKPPELLNNTSQNILSQYNPSKKRRLSNSRKNLCSNEENNQTQYSPAFLCESIILPKESSIESESNPSKGNCSRSNLIGINLSKTKPQGRKEKQQVEINCKGKRYSLKDFKKSIVQSADLSGISESEPLKENHSTITFCSENLTDKTKLKCKNKKVKISGTYTEENNSEVSKITSQPKDTTESFLPDHLKSYSSNSLSVKNLRITSKPCHKRKQLKNNEVKCETQKNDLEGNSKNTVKSSDASRSPELETLSENDPSLLKRTTNNKTSQKQRKDKNVKSNEKQLNRSQDLNKTSQQKSNDKNVKSNEKQLNRSQNLSKIKRPVSVIDESDLSEARLQTRLFGRRQLNEESLPQSSSKKVKNARASKKALQRKMLNPIVSINVLPETRSLASKVNEVLPESSNHENSEEKGVTDSTFAEGSMKQEKGIQAALECYPSNTSKEYSSKSFLPTNHKKIVHSDKCLESNYKISHNQGKPDEEMNFILCDSFADDSIDSSTSESIPDGDNEDCFPMEEDPLQIKDIYPKKDDTINANFLETKIIQNRVRGLNLDSVQKIGLPEDDLCLECTSEDEPSEHCFQNLDSGSDETYVLGDASSTFNISGAQSSDTSSLSNIELLCSSDTFPMFSFSLKVISATITEGVDISKVNTQLVENFDKIKYLVPDCEKDLSLESNIAHYQSKKDCDFLNVESERYQTRKNQTLQVVDHISTPVDLKESSSTSNQDQIVKADLIMDNKIKYEVSEVSENTLIKFEGAEPSLPGKFQQKEEPTECSQMKNFPMELTYHTQEDKQLLRTPDSIKTDIITKKEEEEKDKFSHLLNRNSGGNDERALPETLPTCGLTRVSKEMKMNFHEERVLKVLLRRLEDEEVFQVWKKEGVIPLLKHSYSKTIKGQKNAQHKICSGSNIQKSLKKRKNYKCWVCKKSFAKRDRYWEHRASKCDRVKVFGCGNCNRKYILKKMLDDHRAKCISVKYFRCKVCLKLFSSQERLDEHIASNCDTLEVFRCDVCGRGFILKRLLLIHKTPICTSLRRYNCSVCNQAFDKAQLKTHKLKEHGIGLYPALLCEFCGKLISHKHFRDHTNIHLENPLYHCKLCPKIFQTKKARQYHYEQYHLETKPCVCADCGKAFIRLSDLKKHVTGFGFSYKCDTCGKIIQNQFCYRGHVKSHIKVENSGENGWHCVIKKEPSEYSQWLNEEKPLKCSECEVIFTEKFEMDQHFQRVHQTAMPSHSSEIKAEPYQETPSNVRPFKCNRCSCCYSKKERLIQHVQESHYSLDDCTPVLRDKPFKCKACGTGFDSKNNLSRHEKRMHQTPKLVREIVTSPTRDKPFACEICKICFKEKTSLSRHYRGVHRLNPANIMIPCAFCDAKFTTDVQFREHTLEHLKDCFSVPVSVKQEEQFFENTYVKPLRVVSTPTQEQLLENTDLNLIKNAVTTPTQEQLSVNPDVDLIKNVVATLTQEQLFANTNNKPVRNVVASPTPEEFFANIDSKFLKNVANPNQERNFICRVCGKSFEKQKNLNRHCKRLHSIKQLGPSLLSNEKVKTDSHLKDLTFEHLINEVDQTVKEEENPLINTVVNDGRLLADSILSHPEKASVSINLEQQYFCNVCGRSFARKDYLNKHRRRVHHLRNLNPPSFDNQQIKMDSDLKDVLSSHFNEDIPINQNLIKEENLLINNVVKEDRNLFGASNYFGQQGKESPVNQELKVEETLHTSTDIKEYGNSLSDNNFSQQRKASPNNNVQIGEGVIKSYKLNESFNTIQNISGRKVYPCKECGMRFFENWRLNRHLLSHDPLTLKCDICKKSFSTQVKLNVHMLVHGIKTTAVPSFPCLTCNKLFSSSKRLEEHMVLHTGMSPYQCTKCNSKFTTQFSLRRHNINKHAEKRFLCSYCNMSFVSFSSLNQHVMNVHQKAVSQTEYVLRIDEDDPEDETPLERDFATVTNPQEASTAKMDLQPDIFNVSDLFSRVFNDAPLQSQNQT